MNFNEIFSLGNTMTEIVDNLAQKNYGRTLTDSLENGECVVCGDTGQTPDVFSDHGWKEYLIHGLCEGCQLVIFQDCQEEAYCGEDS